MADTYYVDASQPNDDGDGLSEENAWKTINKVNISSFNPNDFVLFKMGEFWREMLEFPDSGTDGNVITIGAYGNGDDPIINGSDVEAGWELDAGNVWEKTNITKQPYIVIFDGVIGVYQTAKGNLASPGDWYWDDGADTLYTYSETDPDSAYSEVEVAWDRSSCIRLVGNDYITIENLRLYGARSSGLSLNGATHITFRDSEVDSIGLFGSITVDSTYLLYQNLHMHDITVEEAIYFDSTSMPASNNITVEYCNFHDFAENGIYLGGSGHTDVIIRYNRIVDSVDTWNTGSLSGGAAGAGNGIQGGGENIEIYYNYLANTDWRGIQIGGSENVDIYNNVFYGSISHECVDVHTSNDINFKNNIVVTDSNNISLMRFRSTNTNVTISNNQYYTTGNGTNAFNWAGTTYDYDEFAQWEVAASDSNSATGDPKFVNPGSNDFHLESDSPCRNAGVDVSLSPDYDGISVPQETNPAIGAFEYVEGNGIVTLQGAVAAVASVVGGAERFRRIMGAFSTIASVGASITVTGSGQISDYLENALLDHVFKTTEYIPPTNIYVALTKSTIDDTHTGSTLPSEVSGGNYARKICNTWDVASGGKTENSQPIVFNKATANWGMITYFAICDQLSGGNVLFYGALQNLKVINLDDTFRFKTEDLDMFLN